MVTDSRQEAGDLANLEQLDGGDDRLWKTGIGGTLVCLDGTLIKKRITYNAKGLIK